MIGYGDRARTQCEVVRLFRETHPDLPPLNQGTISKIEAQYREMGHVRKVLSKRQAVVDDDTKLNLLLALEEDPITPARQLARDRICGYRSYGVIGLHKSADTELYDSGRLMHNTHIIKSVLHCIEPCNNKRSTSSVGSKFTMSSSRDRTKILKTEPGSG
ncbi:hypothetical protein NQ318_011708 [Aromia moschata]|uniref:DUF4817 domain-containing protein n=1 Tax=Aromia moschata TaxID=1265417 RepID=A0AAV8XRU4_9CUCU|nr:hypothetical protein NQ318_011708 [Aromia moschata]